MQTIVNITAVLRGAVILAMMAVVALRLAQHAIL
jgi:hypothetical protein